MSESLPEGISINRGFEGDTEVELPFVVTNSWNCDKCDLQLETLLIGNDGRYTGNILVLGSNKSTWQGPLPKVKEKAEKLLQDNFKRKVASHMERH